MSDIQEIGMNSISGIINGCILILQKKYENLKLHLARKNKYNREAYTHGKTEFVKRINQLARDLIGK